MKNIDTANNKSLIFLSKLKSLWRDTSAVSAVEFALIAPLLVSIYLGAAETTVGVSINRKVSRVASTVSDLVAQAQAISAADIDSIMNVSAAVMAPTDDTPLRIIVTGVNIDANKKAKVLWSRARNASKAATGSIYPIPSSIKIANSFIVVAQVQYDFSPGFGGAIVGPLHFDKKNYLRPRVGSNVTCTGC